MSPRPLHTAALALAALALTGCTSDYAVPSAAPKPTPTSTVGQWNVGLMVTSENASGKATFTYADGTAKTFRFGGSESEIKDTTMVLVGQRVSVKVSVEDGSGNPSLASCMVYEADFDAEGKISLSSNGGSKGDTFTCQWTNDGTLATPKPEK